MKKRSGQQRKKENRKKKKSQNNNSVKSEVEKEDWGKYRNVPHVDEEKRI